MSTIQLPFLFEFDSMNKNADPSREEQMRPISVMIPYFLPKLSQTRIWSRSRPPSVNFLLSALITIIFLVGLFRFGSLSFAFYFCTVRRKWEDHDRQLACSGRRSRAQWTTSGITLGLD
jgi:hypothetical protein